MTKAPMTLNTLAGLMESGFDTMNGRFDRLEAQMERIETGAGSIEREIIELKQIVSRIDSRFLGVEADIKEIYDKIVILGQKQDRSLADNKELERKLAELINWAKEVSRQTGIPLPKI
jgi:septal ring factor EnvC (AmiA/AmiB activator)